MADKHYHGHRARLRARLADTPEKLKDYEILELLLGYVILRSDTKPMAKALLERFGTLRGVINARPADLSGIPGIGNAVASFFALLKEFIPRHAESPVLSREVLCSPEAVAAMARERLGKLRHEELWIAYVDNSNRLISWEKVSQGSTGSAVLHPRDIITRALLLQATGFILVHNHPGGNSAPSGSDIEITRNLDRAAKTVSLRFLDHVIVTESDAYSMAGDGIL